MYKISLAAARVNAKLTQNEVSAKIGVNKATIVNWENGKTSPTTEYFDKLCSLYRCPRDIIFIPQKFALSE